MNKINKTNNQTKSKSSSKKKWREIEEIRDRYALMKELQDDDFCLDMEIEDLSI